VKEQKICLNCGTENEWQRGQCVSCGHTEFNTPKKLAKGREAGLKEIFTSILLFGASFYFLYLERDEILVNKSILVLVSMVFVVSIGTLINGIYKFRHSKNLLIWHIAVIIIFLTFVIWNFWG